MRRYDLTLTDLPGTAVCVHANAPAADAWLRCYAMQSARFEGDYGCDAFKLEWCDVRTFSAAAIAAGFTLELV